MYYLCIREIKYYLNHINKMDNNNQNQEGQQLQIDLSPEIAKGVYTNFQIISHSSSEFVLDFATLLPGVPKATVTSRVIIAPEHALRLLAALQDNVVRYECISNPFKIKILESRLHIGGDFLFQRGL